MSRLHISTAARADLLEIWAYIAEHNTAAADRLIDDITSTYGVLLTHPEIGRRRDEFRTSLRSFPVRKFVIYYRLRDEGIEIFRVLHGARDGEHQLQDE